MIAIDATCPLVTKVHIEAERHEKQGHHIFLIGHAGHPEVIGTMGQVEDGSMSLIETLEDALSVEPPAGKKLAFATQTTLSVDDTAQIISALQHRFPDISGPRGEDICYATTNRQKAVKDLAPQTSLFLVIGADNSSNSKRLVEVAKNAGAQEAALIADASYLDFDLTDKADIIGHEPVGLLTHEGGEVVDLQSDHLRSRRRMLWNGTMTATVVLSASGELLLAPQVSQTGLCTDDQAADFVAETSLAIEDAVAERVRPGNDDNAIEQIVRTTLRQMAKSQFRLRPTVHVHVMRTDITGVPA